MKQITIVDFIDFLQDNFKTELYRNDVQTIIDTLVNKKLASNTILENNPALSNGVFLYAFFLLHLDVNILPYLEKSSSYTSETFKYLHTDFYLEFATETLRKLTTLIIPGDKKVIKCDFFKDEYSKTSITKIIIEEGVEIVEYNAFSKLKKLKEIYLPASLKSFGDIEDCNNDVTIYYKPVLKSSGKKGVGFRILSLREDNVEWFKSHLKKY